MDSFKVGTGCLKLTLASEKSQFKVTLHFQKKKSEISEIKSIKLNASQSHKFN